MATLESLENKIEVLIGGLDTRFGALDKKIDSLDSKFDTKIDVLDKKIDVLEVSFGGKIDVLDKKIDVLEVSFGGKIDVLDKKIDALDVKFGGKIDDLDVKFENKIDALDTKFENKIDELAAMTARGFLELRGEFKSDMHEVVHRLDVIEENYVTKDDFLKFGRNMDLMLDNHIGTFRKDYDELATRTKNLEKVVFATS